MKTNFTKLIATISMALLVSWIAAGCKKRGAERVPLLTLIEDSTLVIHDRAWLVAEVTDDGGGTITDRGFCYGMEGGPVDTMICDCDAKRFSVELTGLKPSMPYVCRAYAVNDAGWGFGAEYRFTTLNDTIPLVKTVSVTEITPYSAIVSGRVVHGGNQTVMGRGVCYGTGGLPTVEDNKVPAGTGIGSYECQLMLVPETFYYVRAYVECSEGVYYGEQLTFCAEPDVPPLEVRTIGVSDVTGSRVEGRGMVVADGGYEVTEYGFCWGVEHEPTIDGLHLKVGKGMGEFSHYFSGLERGITHYVRAYAVNEESVAYGEEVEFVPDDPFAPWPNGTSPGLFSVSEDHKVRFSYGNLQYCPDDDVWRFAEHQWDFVGGKYYDYYYGGYLNAGTVYVNGVRSDNTLISRYYAGWIDLFGWATSGWDNGNIYFKPYDRTAHKYDCAFYGPPGNYDLTDEYAEADWGVHNTISNGGSRQWRTPSAPEFDYLLVERVTPSGIRFAKAMVAGVVGLIVLPDDWDASYYPLRRVNVDGTFTANIVSAGEWLDVLEPAGAVFLPAAGMRAQHSGENTSYFSYADTYPNDCGASYWTSTQGVGVDNASRLGFRGEDGNIYFYHDYQLFYDHADRCCGYSVRLISDE